MITAAIHMLVALKEVVSAVLFGLMLCLGALLVQICALVFWYRFQNLPGMKVAREEEERFYWQRAIDGEIPEVGHDGTA